MSALNADIGSVTEVRYPIMLYVWRALRTMWNMLVIDEEFLDDVRLEFSGDKLNVVLSVDRAKLVISAELVRSEPSAKVIKVESQKEQ